MEKKIYPYFTPYTEIISRWIIDLNRKSKTIKVPDHNVRELTIVVGKDFLNKIQIALTKMKKIKYWSTLKLETAVLQNATLIEEKVLYISEKWAYPDYMNNFCKPIIQTTQVKNGAKDLNRHFTKELSKWPINISEFLKLIRDPENAHWKHNTLHLHHFWTGQTVGSWLRTVLVHIHGAWTSHTLLLGVCAGRAVLKRDDIY